jgi:hypothetical protein
MLSYEYRKMEKISRRESLISEWIIIQLLHFVATAFLWIQERVHQVTVLRDFIAEKEKTK